MKNSLFSIVCILTTIASPASFGEEVSASPNPKVVEYESWPVEKLYATAAHYYQLQENKKLDDQVVTLNDLDDVIVEPPSKDSKEPKSFRETFIRWGKKPCFLVPLYKVVKQEELRNQFKEIFGKSVKYLQVVCTTYVTDEKVGKNAYRELDPSGMWSLETFSRIDLWLTDEDGKIYVVLSYEPSREFKFNMNYKTLKRLGIHDAKLWN